MASVGLLVATATAATAAALRWAALHRLRDYAAARDVPIDQLDAVARAASPGEPLYVAIHGVARTPHPLKPEHAPSVTAVLVEQEQALVSSVWDGVLGKWLNSEQVIAQSTQTTPFVLQSIAAAEQAAGHAPVAGAAAVAISGEDLAASGLGATRTVHDLLTPTGSALRDIIGYAKGEIVQGTRVVERVVPTGQRLTAFGHLVRDADGAAHWRLVPPSAGMPGLFLLTPLTRAQLERSDRLWARVWTAVLVASATGVAYYLWQWLWPRLAAHLARWKHARRLARRRASDGNPAGATAATAGGPEAAALGNECVVCMDRPRNTVLTPCGHLACCHACATRLSRCPVCRARVAQAVRTFQV